MANQTTEQVEKNLTEALGNNGTSQTIPLVGVTQEELDQWKSKFGEVTAVTVYISVNETVVGYFKKPTRDILANIINLQYAGKTYEAQEFLVNNTFIGGEKKIITDFDCAQACRAKLWPSINFLKAEVTKY